MAGFGDDVFARWRDIQGTLFPWLREELNPVTAALEQLIIVLDTIGFEMNQPIAAAVTNAQAALRWLGAQPPNLEEVREALRRIVENANRASDVIGRIRALIKKAPPRKDGLEINDAVLEVIALTHCETVKTGVSVQTQLAKGLPLIQGDRVKSSST